MQLENGLLYRTVLIGGLGLLGVFAIGQAGASTLEVFHADSLAGPMKELKKAFKGISWEFARWPISPGLRSSLSA